MLMTDDDDNENDNDDNKVQEQLKLIWLVCGFTNVSL